MAVSTDDTSTVAAFARKLNLPFAVLSDPTRHISLAFGVVQSTVEAPSRCSFLLDSAGVVRWIDLDVSPLTHGADVLNRCHELGLVVQRAQANGHSALFTRQR